MVPKQRTRHLAGVFFFTACVTMTQMEQINKVAISGSGKYILATVTKNGKSTELLRGGSKFKMHKDIVASLKNELESGCIVTLHGGGMMMFHDGEHKMIVVSGESQKYGPPDSIVSVLSLLEAAYPAYDILSK